MKFKPLHDRVLIEVLESEEKTADKKDILKSISKIQNDLFNLGTMLAVSSQSKIDKLPSISGKEVVFLEKLIDSYNENLESLDSFVLPSGSLPGAYFHVCRSICRRVERKCVSLSSSENIDKLIVVYLNRLSDLFFVWARWINKTLGVQEDLWKL